MPSKTFSPPVSLADLNVAIMGLGLMGGSLAMALHGKVKFLLGIDPDDATRQFAAEHQVCDRLAAAPDETFQCTDLVILAMPVRTILAFIERLPEYHPGQPIVMDIGSTKTEITQALAQLPERFDVLGAHPMCGKEISSIRVAEASLFQQRTLIFTRLQRTSEHACQIAGQIADTVGSIPLWLDADTHDLRVAATSHLPYLIASALAATTPLEAAPLAGTGYLSTTRLSTSKVEMMLDILMTNREAVLRAMEHFESRMAQYRDALKDGDETALLDMLSTASAHQQVLLDLRKKAGLG